MGVAAVASKQHQLPREPLASRRTHSKHAEGGCGRAEQDQSGKLSHHLKMSVKHLTNCFSAQNIFTYLIGINI